MNEELRKTAGQNKGNRGIGEYVNKFFNVSEAHDTVCSLFHWSLFTSRKRCAFTLAEVLITLGIIGVVAVLTIPNLISNYRKHVVENRLKATYSMFYELYNRAQLENGPVTSWGLFELMNGGNSASAIDLLVEKYTLPYMSGATYYKSTTLENLGYKTNIINPINNSVVTSKTSNGRRIRLKNGIDIVSLYGWKFSSGTWYSIGFVFDVNGSNPPNALGRDIFVVNFDLTNGKVGMMPEYKNTHSTDDVVGSWYNPMTYEEIMQTCSGNPIAFNSSGWTALLYCGNVIRMNGWLIPKDYPYKL